MVCCSPDGSSSRTRVSLRPHWSKHFVSTSVLTSHWTRGFDREQEGRPPRLQKILLQKWVSIRENLEGQKEKKKDAEWKGRRDAQSGRPHPNVISCAGWLPSKVWRCVSSHSWDYFGHLVSFCPAVNTDVCLIYCFALDGRSGFFAASPPRVDLREMSERRRSAAALSSRAHAFSVEALIGSNKKRKLRGWEEKELELSMESLGTDGEDPAHCLDMDPGQCADMHHIALMSEPPLYHAALCNPASSESKHGSISNDPTHYGSCRHHVNVSLKPSERFCSVIRRKTPLYCGRWGA